MRQYGKTRVNYVGPWSIPISKGSRVLCSDGKVRALAMLAKQPDTFFSIPAAIKCKGKYITGYLTTEEGVSKDCKATRTVYAFRQHTESNQKAGNILPEWPGKFTQEHFDLCVCGEEKNW